MGQNHARVYQEISNLVGVADPNSEQGKEVADRFGVQWFSNYKDLIPLVDSVSISTPTIHHYSIAKDFLEYKKNILVEKPFTINVEESIELIKISEKNNLVLAVGHIERHNPVVNFLKNKVLNNESGELISLSSKRFSPYPERISDVGIIFDLSVHDIDVFNYIFNKYPISVYTIGGNYTGKNKEEHVLITLDYGGGNFGFCETSWLSPSKVRKLKAHTSKNIIELDYMSQSVNITQSKYLDLDSSNLFKTSKEENTREINLTREEPLKNELVDFLNCTVSNQVPLVTGLDGYNIVKIAEAALKSLESGLKISI